MKKLVVVLVSLVFGIVVMNAQEGKSSWYERDLTLSLNVRTGTNYAPIFGAKLSDFGFFSMVDLAHKSGFGVGYYRLDDFTKETMGRVGFVDLYWAGSLAKNLSLYAAAEYGWFDNWKDGRFVSPYAIVSYQLRSWTVSVAPVYLYYDRLPEDNHQVLIKMEISKEIFKGTSIRGAGWYDNFNPQKLHYAAGITQNLPANTYVSVDGILRPGGENFVAVGFGWTFSSK